MRMLLSRSIRQCNWRILTRRPLLFGRALSPSIAVRCYETVSIPVGSNGSVSLDLFFPSTVPKRPGLVIYFPRGPISFNDKVNREPTDIQSLADAAEKLVIRLNYRLSSNEHERFPLPVHDVGQAWSWIEENIEGLIPASNGNRQRRNIGVAGEFIGGGLAAMLALTNCRLAPGPAITTAYLGNPIVDWTMMTAVPSESSTIEQGSTELDETKASKKKKKKDVELSSWLVNASNPLLPSTKLLSMKHSLFANHHYPFDPYASPLLFFRTPATPLPNPGQAEDEIFTALQGAEIEQDLTSETLLDSFIDNQAGLDHGTATTTQGMEGNESPVSPTINPQETPQGLSQAEAEPIKKQRPFTRSYRRWPPMRSGFGLPSMHLTLGTSSPLRDMALEFAANVERGVRLYEPKPEEDMYTRGARNMMNDERDAYLQYLLAAAGVTTSESDATQQSIAEFDYTQTTEQRGASKKKGATGGTGETDRVTVENVDGLGAWDDGSLVEMGRWFRSR